MRTLMCCVTLLGGIGLAFASRADEPKDGPVIESEGVIHHVAGVDSGADGDVPTVKNPSNARAETVPLKPIDPELVSQFATRLREEAFAGHAETLEELTELLKTRSTSNLEPLVEPLFKLSGWGGASRHNSRLAEYLIVWMGELAVPWLEGRVIWSDGHDRRVAAELLTRIGPADAALAHLLCPLLTDSDEFVRRVAIDGLGIVGPAASDFVDDLESAAKNDPKLSLRVCARITLIKITGASEERVRALAAFLEMKDEAEAGPRGKIKQSDIEAAASHAASALGKMGSKAQAATPILLVALQDPTMRHIAARTLGEIGSKSPEAIAVLIDILKHDPENEVRRSAASALGDFGPAAKDAIPALRQELNGDPKRGWWLAADTLGKIGGEDVVPILIEALENRDGDIRRASMRALGDLGTLAQPAIAALEKARNDDPLSYNRAAAAEALPKIEKASVQ